MADIKYYKHGMGVGDNFYHIDSNILINIGKFYFDAQCGSDNVLTEQIRQFIMQCRKNEYLSYVHALLEICYDSGTNSINSDMKILFSRDNVRNCAQFMPPRQGSTRGV